MFSFSHLSALYKAECPRTLLQALDGIARDYFGSSAVILAGQHRGTGLCAISNDRRIAELWSKEGGSEKYRDLLKYYEIKGRTISCGRGYVRSPYGRKMRRLGYHRCRSMACQATLPRGTHVLIALHRQRDNSQYTHEDVARFNVVRVHAVKAFDRIRRIETIEESKTGYELVLRQHPVPLLLLNWSEEILFYNQAAKVACCRISHGPTAKLTRKINLPAELIGGIRTLKTALKQGSKKVSTEVHCHAVEPASFRVSCKLAPRGSLIPGVVMVIGSSHGSEMPPPEFALLSPSEQTVVRLILAGFTYRAIAQRTGKSMATVHNQAVSVNRKLNIRGRHALWRFFSARPSPAF